MKSILILIVLGAAAYLGYQRLQAPVALDEPIENPVYVEIRTSMNAGGRDLELGLFGKMTSEEDCRERSQRVWEQALRGCGECKLTVNSCKTELPARYARLFDNAPIHSAYLSFTRGVPEERDGRMVIWGLSANEGNAVCERARAEFQKGYTGKIACVPARSE